MSSETFPASKVLQECSRSLMGVSLTLGWLSGWKSYWPSAYFQTFWTVFHCLDDLDKGNCVNLVFLSLPGYVNYHNRMRQAVHVHHRTFSTLARGHQKWKLGISTCDWLLTVTLGLILGPFSAGLVVWVMSSDTFPEKVTEPQLISSMFGLYFTWTLVYHLAEKPTVPQLISSIFGLFSTAARS